MIDRFYLLTGRTAWQKTCHRLKDTVVHSSVKFNNSGSRNTKINIDGLWLLIISSWYHYDLITAQQQATHKNSIQRINNNNNDNGGDYNDYKNDHGSNKIMVTVMIKMTRIR